MKEKEREKYSSRIMLQPDLSLILSLIGRFNLTKNETRHGFEKDRKIERKKERKGKWILEKEKSKGRKRGN